MYSIKVMPCIGTANGGVQRDRKMVRDSCLWAMKPDRDKFGTICDQHCMQLNHIDCHRHCVAKAIEEFPEGQIVTIHL